MKKVLSLFLLLIPAVLFGQGLNPQLTENEAIEDMKYLRKNLEDYHPGMNRFTPKTEMDEAYSKAIADASDISLFKFYGEISRLLTFIHCGHTQSYLPERSSSSYRNELKLIPFEISFLEGKMLVSEDYSAEKVLERGTEIISIDGIKTQDILSYLFERINNDGFVESFRYEWLEIFFWYLYPLNFSETGLPESYSVEYRKPYEEVTHVLELDGLTQSEIKEIKAGSDEENEMYSTTIEDDYALMKITSFSGSPSDFKGYLRESFKEINEAGINNLILDLRDNGGGTDEYGAKLVSYLAHSDFNYFDRIEVKEKYAKKKRGVKSKDGIYYYQNHVGLKKWSPDKNRFLGEVYVLTNGISFSTTADVASVLFDNGWATFIGQETGGGAYGNTSGETKTITLPNSRIEVSIPMWMYFTALKNTDPKGRGVIPNYVTSSSLQDFIDEKDIEMEKAISLIKSK